MSHLTVVEVRVLDGANIFLRQPAVKLQVRFSGEAAVGATIGPDLLLPAIHDLHHALDLPQPAATTQLRPLTGADHTIFDIIVAFTWEWRTCAEGIAETAIAAAEAQLAGDPFAYAPHLAALHAALATDRAEHDRPRFIRDSERHMPLVGITGTNGKTTTTRCLTHILTVAGRRVGMANSNGVWIAGEQVLDGDYTGPQGARRVLEESSVEIAVLETARGGMLLRGIAYESNDVGVVTNISADHLGLQGIDTIEQLAEVKSLVIRLTRPAGTVVLNADDPLVLAMSSASQAPVIIFSRHPVSDPVRNHLATGGRAVLTAGDNIVIAAETSLTPLIPLANVPITYGGRATHMVENALAAAATALALGLSPATIAAGLATFRNTPEQNFGRLHVFALREPACTFIVDYAHNEAGLDQLLRFGATFVGPGGRLLAIIGTAGDRPDNVLRGIGRLAGQQAVYVWIRETEQFLRGRTRDDMNALFAAGVVEGRGNPDGYSIVPDELTALDAALDAAHDGDAIVMMCFEQQAEVLAALTERGEIE